MADPYKNFKFRVKWDGHSVAGVSRVSALGRTADGQTKYKPITLERGVTHDEEFVRWAGRFSNLGAGQGAPPKDFRKDLVIEVHNEAGQVVLAYRVFGCWVAEFQLVPDLDANANAVGIQHVKLEHEGWERDDIVVVEP